MDPDCVDPDCVDPDCEDLDCLAVGPGPLPGRQNCMPVDHVLVRCKGEGGAGHPGVFQTHTEAPAFLT